MTIKEKALTLFRKIDKKFSAHFGFRMKDVTFTKIVTYLHKPVDSSSLAVARILFGLCMLLDIPDERGGSVMDLRWGQPMKCHFPLFPYITAVPMPYMALVYAASWIGALGITLGYKFKLSSAVFTICHWYILLIDKSFWNNHSYLFGLVGLLMTFTQANCYWSIDTYLNPSLRSTTVPYWNYFILKYQFTILYFMAGVKKGTAEWLSGYSVRRIAEHWVFDPFKNFLSVSQINHLIVHWFIFVFDLTVAFWMMWGRTRTVAMLFCALFHLMNSRLFAIDMCHNFAMTNKKGSTFFVRENKDLNSTFISGMFPWVCLATMPLFYPFDWPKRIHFIKEIFKYIQSWFLFIPGARTITCICNKQIRITNDKDGMCRDNDNSDRAFDNDESQENLIDNNDRNGESFDETCDKTYNEEADETFDKAYKTGDDNHHENVVNSDIINQKNIQDKTHNSFDNFHEESGDDKFDNSHNHQVIDNNKPLIEESKNFEEINTKIYTKSSTLKSNVLTTVETKTAECKDEINHEKGTSSKDKVGSRKNLTTVAIVMFVALQAFLPFSHFITKGYNNWTEGLYGYSWDMMVHTWTDSAVAVKVTDNDSGRTYYVDPDVFTLNDRWTRHGDMVHQFAKCLGHFLTSSEELNSPKLINISIYVDIWYSLNGRFTQRMFDPKMDLLKTPWSPFEKVPYLVPLLDNDEALQWRGVMDDMKMNAVTWKNYTDFAFYADFPGYDQEKYISDELQNVTLTILEGAVGLETSAGSTLQITRGKQVEIPSGNFYILINIGTRPAYYTFMFTNVTEMETAYKMDSVAKPKLPIAKELHARFEKMRMFANLVFRNVFYCFLMSRCS